MKRIQLAILVIALGLFAISGFDALAQQRRPSHTPQSPPPPTKTLYEVMEEQKNLSAFVGLVDDAGLKAALNGTTPMTVFAPTDDAIDDIPKDVMKRIKDSDASLQSYVKYHFISNSLVGASAIRGRKVSPASDNGEPLQFDGTDPKAGPLVDGATLVQTDIQASNGVIHIVSKALVPPSLMAAPPPPPPPPPPPKPAATPAAPVAPTPPVANATPPSVAPVAPANAAAAGTASPLQPTTTPAMPPAETTTGAVPEVTPESPAQEPSPATPPASGDSGSKGFTLFGHTFGW
jgi:uncharacterized surface protein with fasciclin (FAS1) repeats